MNSRRDYKDPFLSLLLKVTAEDRDAFETLYRNTCQRVKVYLHRLLQDQDCIDDLLVETYIQVWKSCSRFQGKSKVLTWIIGIARNLAFKEMERRKPNDDINAHPELASSRIDLDTGNRKEVLSRAFEELSVKHREILDLAFYHDLPYLEIAKFLSIPESTVKSRVFYAKAALKTALAQMGVHRGDI